MTISNKKRILSISVDIDHEKKAVLLNDGTIPPGKNRSLKFRLALIDPGLDLRTQGFYLLCYIAVFIGIVVGIASVPANIIFGRNLGIIVCDLLLIAGGCVAMWFHRRYGRLRLISVLVVIFAFFIMFPVIFFLQSGYRGSMPFFFILAFLFTAGLAEGKLRVGLIIAEFALYVSCCMVAFYFPGSVRMPLTEGVHVIEAIAGISIAGIALILLVLQYARIYNNRQKRLEELDKLKTEFLENVSHEMKTPLTVIANNARNTRHDLEKESLDIPEMNYFLTRIISESDRLNRMVSQLLDTTALESGRFQIRKNLLSLSDLLREVIHDDYPKLNENSNRLELMAAGALPEVYADKEAIAQVLLNLLSNSARHTKQGVITVTLKAKDEWQEVRVTDNGEGMEPEILDQVFARYIDRKSKITGRSGMGLYICKKIIDAHGGKIGAHSGAGCGTTVWFRLPAGQKGGHRQ